jgi:hypothetical protein
VLLLMQVGQAAADVGHQQACMQRANSRQCQKGTGQLWQFLCWDGCDLMLSHPCLLLLLLCQTCSMLYRLLKHTCLNCHQFKMGRQEVSNNRLLAMQLWQ